MPRFPATSPSAQSLSDSVYSALVRRARERNLRPHPLHVGDTYLSPLAAARAESQREADIPRLHNYTPVQGEPALLDAIAARLATRRGSAIDPEALQVTVGATSGLAIVVNALCDAGDEVIIPSPYWPLIRGIVAARGAVPVEVPFLAHAGEPSLFDDPARATRAIEAAITERTVAVYLNSPNNPSGAVIEPDVLAAIGRLCAERNLWLVSDEAYADLYFDNAAPPSPFDLPELAERTISAFTASKSYGLAGARVGWLHGPAAAMRTVRGLQTFQTYCAARPMQLATAHALAGGSEWLATLRTLYRDAAASTAAALAIPMPRGGTFAFFDATPFFRASDDPMLDFLERCLDAGVLVTPGSASGRAYASFVRVCFTAVPPVELADALTRLRTVLFP